MENRARRINLTESRDDAVKEEFLAYVKQNMALITEALVVRLNQPGSFNAITIINGIEAASEAFESFYRMIERNDPSKIEGQIKSLLKHGRDRKAILLDLQKIFAHLRNVIVQSMIKGCESQILLSASIKYINSAIDRINYYIVETCYEDDDQGSRVCKNEAGKKAQQINREYVDSNNSYQSLFDEISDGCYVSKRGKIVLVNRAFCEMHDYSPEELIGKECKDLVAESYKGLVLDQFNKQMRGEVPYKRYVYCGQDKSGRYFPIESKMKFINYEGEPAVIGLCSNITERVEAEKKLRQQHRFALLGTLAASIAHEIRNPLTSIKINIKVLLGKLNLGGNDLRRLQIAYEQLGHAENLMSQTLEFAKPLDLKYAATNAEKFIDDLVNHYEHRLRNSNVSLVSRIDSNIKDIVMDPEMMFQAMDNLLRNSIEALDEQNTECKKIQIILKSEYYNLKDCVKLTISDNGKGIQPEHKEDLFDPFFTYGKKDGVGLGLSVTKKIVEAHHGQIDVDIEKEDEEGQTSFNIYLPVDIYGIDAKSFYIKNELF
jgi:PAS domain S-box-containing protein